MNAHYDENNTVVDDDPVIGCIILMSTTMEELRSYMNQIIALGNDESSIHTIYFEDERLGLVVIEPNNLFKQKQDNNINEEMMVESINTQVEMMHLTGSYAIIWAKYEINEYLMDNECYNYEITMDGTTSKRVVHIRKTENSVTTELIQLPLI